MFTHTCETPCQKEESGDFPVINSIVQIHGRLCTRLATCLPDPPANRTIAAMHTHIHVYTITRPEFIEQECVGVAVGAAVGVVHYQNGRVFLFRAHLLTTP